MRLSYLAACDNVNPKKKALVTTKGPAGDAFTASPLLSRTYAACVTDYTPSTLQTHEVIWL